MAAWSRPSHRFAARWIFVLFAAGFGLTALVHAIAIGMPSIAPAPAWRHALFVFIDGAVAILMLRRPRWFAVAFALLCAQQVYSHGTTAWSMWISAHRIDWASGVVLAALPLAAVLLWRDARR